MDHQQQNLIHTLWDELADFDAARSDEALRHLMQRLCALAGACNASWMGSVRLDNSIAEDPVKGWRVRNVHFLYPSKPLDAAANEQIDKLESGRVDITTRRNVENAGTFRANRLRDLVDGAWFDSWYYRTYFLGVGHADAIWIAFPVNEDAESWFGIYRGPKAAPFTPADRNVIAYALRGIKWFHRQIMLSHGLLVAADTLTQAERRVLHLLLTGRPEKQIATDIGRSYHTVHECVTAIFRKYGVNNRAALMALWLGAPPD